MTWQTRTLGLSDLPEISGATGWLTTRDHKRIGLMIVGTALFLFFVFGAMAMMMRTQLRGPHEHVVTPYLYDQLFTIHGSGMIYMVVTPLALGAGVYLVPLQIGSPVIAAPRATLFGYWMYLFGALSMLLGFITYDGAASDGWFAYTPLSTNRYTPSVGQSLWILGTFISTIGMMIFAGTTLWTIIRMRAPRMTMLRLPVFSWSILATDLMALMAFPSLLVAVGIMAIGRVNSNLFKHNVWNVAYQHIFWFYGHPVVYVMFFPFVGMVAEVLSTFTGRRFFGYKGTVLSLLLFSALSMSVWGHHMFATGQAADDYYSLTSTLLTLPAGLEYFGFLGTLIGGRIRYRTPMLFAMAFIPQFLIGGLTGVMVGSPSLDRHVTDSYFVVAHFHYTLFAGSLFGFFAGFYFWFPKAIGWRLDERLGRLHFVLMVIGANVTFLPMFALGYLGMPRRVATYPANAGWTTLNEVSSIGSFIIGGSMLILVYNVVMSVVRKIPAGDDPWGGHSLEWAAASPPSRFNFDADHKLPPITSYAPLLDLQLATGQAKLE